ncbi:hypothetical protein ACFQ0B_33825 [Nonomuraea thailandensis]
MGYPPLPSGPYGPQPAYQQPPYGPRPFQGGHAHGPAHQEPVAAPPSPRDNLPLIVLLAVGVPLLLLGACAAVVMVLTDDGRPAVLADADGPNMVITTEPLPSEPPATGTPWVTPRACRRRTRPVSSHRPARRTCPASAGPPRASRPRARRGRRGRPGKRGRRGSSRPRWAARSPCRAWTPLSR